MLNNASHGYWFKSQQHIHKHYCIKLPKKSEWEINGNTHESIPSSVAKVSASFTSATIAATCVKGGGCKSSNDLQHSSRFGKNGPKSKDFPHASKKIFGSANNRWVTFSHFWGGIQSPPPSEGSHCKSPSLG